MDVDEATLEMLDLQPAWRVVAAHEGHDAVIGVHAPAQLSRQWRRSHRRIADHAHYACLAIELVGEIALAGAERRCHGPQYKRRHLRESAVIVQHDLLEAGRPRRP